MSESATVVLRPESRFDFSSFRGFRSAYEAALDTAATKLIVIDMQAVQYIDSAALGILLLLRDRAAKQQCSVELHNLTGAPKDVLEIANFHKIFTVR